MRLFDVVVDCLSIADIQSSDKYIVADPSNSIGVLQEGYILKTNIMLGFCCKWCQIDKT
jgi:hypothetical protein